VDRLFAQLLEDDLQPAEREELSRSLRDDPAVRLLYRKYMIVDAMLRWEIAPPLMWMGEDSGCGVQGSGFRVQELGCPEPAGPSLDSLAADGEPMIPPIIIRTSPAVDSPLFSTLFAPGGWAFSYAAATVVTGLLLLVLWAWTVSHDRELAGLPPHSTLPAVGPEKPRELVGRIIGTADCRWANPDDIPPAAIRVGRKYELASGLLEISYLSGAKVILQGPCTYEIDSPAGGFLSLGKLTARVEQGSGVRGQSSEHYPLSTSHNPLFSVRTPTAIVSDLGTEFGVEVDKSGVSRTHVFRGRVELRAVGGQRVIRLRENESARVERGASREVEMVREPARPGTFVRRIPRRVPIELSDTGRELRVGDADPHWQLVARSDNPQMKPQPAVVAEYDFWEANAPHQSQWISTGGDLQLIPNNVTYTFRTTFKLEGLQSGSATLRGWFIADNHLDAIRLNGRPVRVPEHPLDPFNRFYQFKTDTGFVEGRNTLEFDVYNGNPADDLREHPAGPMGLRVELEGSYIAK
jgi:hypothetical protein